MLGALLLARSIGGLAIDHDGDFSAARTEAAVEQCGYATGPVTRAGADPPGALPWITPPESGAEPLLFFARDRDDVGRQDGRLFAVLVFADEARASRMYATARERAAAGQHDV